MYSGSFPFIPFRKSLALTACSSSTTTYATNLLLPPSSSLATTTHSLTPDCSLSAASTSPNSIRYPLTFTCSSLLPTYSISPPSLYRHTSPVRYNLSPPSTPYGFGTNRSAVNSGLLKYPRASPSPPMYSSPATPTGTTPIRSSTTYAVVLLIGPPIPTVRAPSFTSSTSPLVANVVLSVGPYTCNSLFGLPFSITSLTLFTSTASPPNSTLPTPWYASGRSRAISLNSAVVMNSTLIPVCSIFSA